MAQNVRVITREKVMDPDVLFRRIDKTKQLYQAARWKPKHISSRIHRGLISLTMRLERQVPLGA